MRRSGLGLNRQRRAIGAAGPAPYLGYAATRGNMSDTNGGGGVTAVGGRRMMRVRGSCSGFRFKFMHWWWNGSGLTEQVPAGGATIEASLEYPSGTFTRFLFATTSAGAVAAGADIVSDALALAVPDGATVWLNWLATGTGLGYSNTPHNTAAGDRFEFSFGGGVTNRVMTGGWVNGDGSGNTGASGVALLAQTTLPSGLLLTDSKGWVGDTNDASGDRGEVARSVGPSYGYCAMASAGDQLAALAASGARRRRQAAHASFVLSNMSVNSVGPLATYQSQVGGFWASSEFAGKKLYHTTLTPETSGTYTSDAGQTPLSGFAAGGNCDQINSWLRGVPSPLAGVFDVRSALQSGTSPNVWYNNGGVAHTGDGVHPTQTGYLRVQAQGVVNPAVITL